MAVGRGKELLGLSLEWWALRGLWLGWWAMELLAVLAEVGVGCLVVVAM